jgi:hypothetical protein
MLEVDLPAMRQYVENLDYRPLFVTVRTCPEISVTSCVCVVLA